VRITHLPVRRAKQFKHIRMNGVLHRMPVNLQQDIALMDLFAPCCKAAFSVVTSCISMLVRE
jgi:hypothetical protein